MVAEGGGDKVRMGAEAGRGAGVVVEECRRAATVVLARWRPTLPPVPPGRTAGGRGGNRAEGAEGIGGGTREPSGIIRQKGGAGAGAGGSEGSRGPAKIH